ncbi:MAG: tRNA glutamyl-Q(34) synthetase GluQRS [Kiritimatiellae bacterium]|nr:tRNA glutamyl-Q(34) synthetase GluQRS [Kiritimatiellia bacterium]
MGEVLDRGPLDGGYVGRLAPSPTGALHLGNARTFMVAWLRARSQGGRVVMRMEDLDHPRDKPGAASAALEDLRWLGFDWDEEHVQSARKAIYREALGFLHARGLVYPCVCSRRDVESAQSAPHAGDQLHYPGTCRGRFAGWKEAFDFLNPVPAVPPRLPCWRFRVEPGVRVAFEDAFAGRFEADVSERLGDFPLARDEGGAGYTLAAVVDDLLMGVTEVVRGDDLLAATPAQILVARALLDWLPESRRRLPTYCHVPLVVGSDGRRLAKRHGDTRIAAFRESGASAESVVGLLAASCGWCSPGERVSLRALLPRFDLSTIPRRPFVLRDAQNIFPT